MQRKPKLSDLTSLKLNDWFKVGEKIDIDLPSLRHIKRRYKDNRHGCQKGMFAKWIRSEQPQSYEPLLQALINAGETRAAEELRQKFGIPCPLLSLQPAPLIGSECLRNINIVLCGPDKAAKSRLNEVINEYIEERRGPKLRKWKGELESIRPIWEDNEWTNPTFQSFVEKDFPKIKTWRRVDMGELAEVNEIGPLLLTTRSFNFVCLDVQSDCPIPLYDASSSYVNLFSQFKQSLFQQTFHTIGSLWSKDGKFSSKAYAAAVVCHFGSRDPMDKYAAQIDAIFKSYLQESGFFQGNVIKFCHFRTGQMMFPITKYSDEHHDRIKSMLGDVTRHQCCEKIVPTSVYKFVCLCHSMGSVLNINEAEELAYVCGLRKGEVGHVLNYIREKFGVILYYRDVPALDNVVICRPQLLIDAFTRLVNEIAQLNPEIHFSGKIDCNAVSDHAFPNEISSLQVIELLKHFKFISEINFDGILGKYFMPFLLSYNPLVDKASTALWRGYYPFPIAICFSTNKIPAGIFYALVCQLTKSWQLSTEQQYKNRIVFQLEQSIFCSLADYSHFVEIHISGTSEDTPPILYCCILKEIWDKLEYVMASFHDQHTEQVVAMVRFFCPSISEQQLLHLATIDVNRKIQCDQCSRVFECPENYSVWFSNQEDLHYFFNPLSKLKLTSDENDDLFTLVQDHIEHEGSIKLRVAKSVFVGPPNVGKTSLRMRLTGEIRNLREGMPNGSSGIEKPTTVSIYHATERESILIQNDSNQWRPQDPKSQADLFFNLVIHGDKFKAPLPSNVLPHFSSHSHQLKTVEMDNLAQDNSIMTSDDAPFHLASTILPTQNESSGVLVRVNPTKQQQQQPLWLIQQDESSLFVQEMIKVGRWKELQEFLKDIDDLTMLQIIDTGGQPEFHEILPLLLPGPALFLLFTNLAQKFNESYEIVYTQQDRMLSPIRYTSNFTYKEMLLQLLTTISSMNSCSHNSRSIAMILGTHADKVTREDLTLLEESILASEEIRMFIDRGLLRCTPLENVSQCLFPLDNLDGSPEEIQELRKIIGSVCQAYFQPKDIPTSWFFFYVALRNKYEASPGYCSIEEATLLASGYNISHEKVIQVLLFIQDRFGTILFYPDIPSVRGLVICDPNVVFKPISHLIAASFGDSLCDPVLIKEIRSSGQFSPNFFKRLSHFDTVITPASIVDILIHRKIVSEVYRSKNIPVLFMPCLLQPDPDVGSVDVVQMDQLNAAPLVVNFNKGFVPFGFFPALIVQLSHKWLLQNLTQQYRNHIFFIVDPRKLTGIELLLYANRIEIRVDCDNLMDARKLCVAALSEIRESIEAVKMVVEYMKNIQVDFGFYCPQSLKEWSKPHFAHCLELDRPDKMLCVNVSCNSKRCDLLDKHKIWFSEHEDPVEEMDTSLSPPQSNKIDTLLKENQVSYLLESKPEKLDLLSLLSPIAYHWQLIGTALKIDDGDLKSLHRDQRYTDIDRLSEALQLWFNKQPTEVTWKTMLSVLEKPPIKNLAVAGEIRKFVTAKFNSLACT